MQVGNLHREPIFVGTTSNSIQIDRSFPKVAAANRDAIESAGHRGSAFIVEQRKGRWKKTVLTDASMAQLSSNLIID